MTEITRAQRRELKSSLRDALVNNEGKISNIIELRRKERSLLLANGVKQLVAKGYKDVTEHSLVADLVHSSMFSGMLKENLGRTLDQSILGLLDEISTNFPPKQAKGKNLTRFIKAAIKDGRFA